MIEACRRLGSTISVHESHLAITGAGGCINTIDDVIDAGNSGIVLRFVSALMALSRNYGVITGDMSIRHQRDMQPLLLALQQLGTHAISTKNDGYAPIIIRGPLKAGIARLKGNDSQHVSALLIAASCVKGTTEIYVDEPGEKPWIALTLCWLKKMGIEYENNEYRHLKVHGKGTFPGFDYTVPGDFSSAAFPIAGALITGSEITLNNIDMDDPQGDKQLILTLQEMGANIHINANAKTLEIKSGASLHGRRLDINDYIDALPILAVIACFCKGETHITNAAIARGKESNRIQAIASELTKMGARIQELPDGLIVQESKLQGASLHSHNDHRIAMALMCAALGATGTTYIDNTECVAKAYPDIAADFKRMGAAVDCANSST